MLEAYSWLGRGALARKEYDRAAAYAEKTQQQALPLLKKRPLDADKNLPIALGAAIEVRAQVLAAKGDRAAALEYLNGELDAYRNTSIRTRIQKNINLLGLEGKRAPKLEGAPLPQGKPALLFFWAHWCPDCKNMDPVLARLRSEFKNLAVVAPTQLYGYAERGREVGEAEERSYIARIFKEHYPSIGGVAAPVSAENFKVYGASTTPTVVLVDAAGIVRLYHPGKLTYEELRPKIDALTSAPRR
jgi:thiol-disulfide isomerase/thioredoxin